MLAALPLVAFALLWAWRTRASADWRDAWVDAACAWGAILWLSTEALSAFHVLDGASTAVVWLVVVVAAAPSGARSLPGILRRLATDAAASPLEGRVVLATLAALALFTGIVGCLSLGLGNVQPLTAHSNVSQMPTGCREFRRAAHGTCQQFVAPSVFARRFGLQRRPNIQTRLKTCLQIA